jgi:DNA-binding GntR family transcriptional regulator
MISSQKHAPKNTQSNEALVKILNAIVEGNLRPNQRLVDTQLAEQLGIGRTPIRESLIKLEMMGYLYSLPRGGLAVIENTPKRRNDIFEIREMFETYAIKDFCEHATEEQIAKAEEYNRLTGEAASNNNPDDYSRCFSLYVEAILEGCRNEILVTLIKFRGDITFVSKTVVILKANELLRAVEKRRETLEACRLRSCAKAQRSVKELVWWEAKLLEQKTDLYYYGTPGISTF